MKIVTYRELEDKSSMLPLMEQAFGWSFDEEEFEKTIRIDPGLKESCVGLCAIDRGKTVGYVGIMNLTTRTIDGAVERVGGIYGVATMPGHTRHGICGSLMNRAHEYLIQKGYRFSFLTTNLTIAAHDLYTKLGYFDVTSFPGAYKSLVKKKKAEKPLRVTGFDFTKMLEIYDKYAIDRTGFAVRDQAYLKALVKTSKISARDCVISDKGYVIFKKEKKQIRVRELVTNDEKEMHNLILLVEDMAENLVYARAVLDRDLQNAYRSHGYIVLKAGHGVIMVKELADLSFKEAYGDKFYMSSLDHF